MFESKCDEKNKKEKQRDVDNKSQSKIDNKQIIKVDNNKRESFFYEYFNFF